MAATPTTALRGRTEELSRLDDALYRVRHGASGALVLRGEAGIGKTTLLAYLSERATGCRVAAVTGMESELELPFAALHQLCSPMLDLIAGLPDPQQRALRIAFGYVAGDAPDKFVLGLAVLGLLAEAANDQPAVCLIDDAQWIDDASIQILGFVARRLAAESVLMVFAVREPEGEKLLAGIPALPVSGLGHDAALALLTATLPGQFDSRVRDRIVAETRGNPLALLELAQRGKAELMGGFAFPAIGAGSLHDHYVRRIRALPDPTRHLLLLAAAEPTGDATVLWRAAESLGLRPSAAAPAGEEQLFEVGGQARFSHPLIRSAAYAAGTAEERRTVNAALADALDPESEPERRVWHLGAATTGPDEKVATALYDAAERARTRGGVAAAASFLQRAAALTADARLRTERTLEAAQAQLDAGRYDTALGLVAEAEAGAVDELQRARADLVRGLTGRAARSGSDAALALLRAARRLESLDRRLARDTYVDAWGAALVAGRLADADADLVTVSGAACAVPAADPPDPADALGSGLATMVTAGTAAAAPALREAVTYFLDAELPTDVFLRRGVLVANAALSLWDFEAWDAVSSRHVELARRAGALAPLANALNAHRVVALWRGDVEHARALGLEEQRVKEVTGTLRASYGDLFLLAYQGNATRAEPVLATAAAEATARGEGLGLQITHRATALLQLGLGRYDLAFDAAVRAADGNLGPFTAQALPDLVEAAVRSGAVAAAMTALDRLTTYTAVPDSDWAAGLLARARALTGPDDTAEHFYAESVDCLGRTRLRFELARSSLLFGEWLRRQRRRGDARTHLKRAFEEFVAMGADGFAERARHELLATGEKVRKRTADTRNDLTPQEHQIAQLARDGRTNQEIGSELYLSARTVEWHLRKVFDKLGITSRRGLRDALPDRVADRVRAE
ncbi:ATP-binding protein [Nocardia stercoris]|uniref:Helix-turn-helix transcriptional regulator n=1 Tax=Nocardia stercoris TaxID=2483361 RepID=A0A3M2KZK4_9NOCA|nr:LuxR family transcriptional regulator [Nocardia stercoris]RMI28975.1 helix-turn-helix transcriptional regulator [Nocardia stercoris]